MIAIVAARGQNYELGYMRRLCWSMQRADMHRFAEVTTDGATGIEIGGAIVMGRVTYESFPKRPLRRRQNIVVTSDPLSVAGVETAASLKDALRLVPDGRNTFIIGGASIYRAAYEFADRIYLTIVEGSFAADVFFPRFDERQWAVIYDLPYPADETNQFPYRFQVLERRVDV